MSINNFFENKIISATGACAIVLGPLSDAIAKSWVTWTVFAILFVLFIYGIWSEINKYKKFKKEMIHIPVVIKIDEGPNSRYVMNTLITDIEKEYGYSDYENDLNKYFSINLDHLIFEENCNMYDFDRVMNLARIVRYNCRQLEKAIGRPVEFHIAFYRRPAIGFLMGTMFRTNNITVYQNSDSTNKFEKVADIKGRKYKESIENFSKYTVKEELYGKDNDTVLVVIDSASHSVKMKDNNLENFKNVVTVTLNSNGTIPYEDDWTEYAQEIYNVLNKLQKEFKSITIAHSMPEALSIILGMGMENYWNVDITQYTNSEYPIIYNMNQIKYYF